MTTVRTRTGIGRLAINRLESARPLDAEAVDEFLGRVTYGRVVVLRTQQLPALLEQ